MWLYENKFFFLRNRNIDSNICLNNKLQHCSHMNPSHIYTVLCWSSLSLLFYWKLDAVTDPPPTSFTTIPDTEGLVINALARDLMSPSGGLGKNHYFVNSEILGIHIWRKKKNA